MDFRFVHAADLHLDSPFKGLAVPDRLRPIFERATFRALSRIVDLCLAENAAFMVLSGDLFDDKDRSVRARLELAKELGRLDARGVPCFVVHGNHDPLRGLRPGVGLPPSVKVFGPEWEEVPVMRGGRVLCRVQGISYAQEKVHDDLSARFSRSGEEFTVGVLHANLGGQAGHALYAPCSADDLSERRLDYWALGHVHTRAVHPLECGLAVYPGNPQGRHVNEAGPRGCAVVDVRGGRAFPRFVDLDAVRWHLVEVDVSGVASVEALGERVLERLAERASGPGVEAHAARIVLAGRGPVHAELRAPDAVKELEAVWREEASLLSPPWALESVRDETAPALDFRAVRAGGGLLARLLDDAASPAAVKELFAEEELAKLVRKLEQLRVLSPKDGAAELVRLAAESVVERLAEEVS